MLGVGVASCVPHTVAALNVAPGADLNNAGEGRHSGFLLKGNGLLTAPFDVLFEGSVTRIDQSTVHNLVLTLDDQPFHNALCHFFTFLCSHFRQALCHAGSLIWVSSSIASMAAATPSVLYTAWT